MAEQRPEMAAMPRGGARRGRRSRVGMVAKVIGMSTLMLSMVVGLAAAYYVRGLDDNISEDDPYERITNRPAAPEITGPDGPINLLVMGSDTRDGDGNEIGGGLDEVEGERSDTTILLHISADRTNAYGVSIPRDSMVARPDCIGEDGETIPGAEVDMFNTAFELGGTACTIQTVEQLTGVRVTNHVVVDFQGFQGMVDAIDGVEVCLPNPIDDPLAKIDLPAGVQTLEGRDALGYVRTRSSQASANADLGRAKRQQAFVASMIKKVVSSETLLRPDRLLGFLNEATSSLTADPELADVRRLAGLAQQLSDVGLDNILFVTVPVQDYAPDPNRVEWLESADDIWQAMIDDEPLTGEVVREAITARDPVGTGDDEPGGESTGQPGDGRPDDGATGSADPGEPGGGETSGTADPETPEPDRGEFASRNGLCG